MRAVCVLPAGKAALTLGADKKVKLWNLVTGKCALSVPLSKGTNAFFFLSFKMLCVRAFYCVCILCATLASCMLHMRTP